MPPSPRQFAQADADNPDIWKLFVRFSFEMIRRGFHHYSAYAVMHRVRWETAAVLEEEDQSYKIRNDYIPYYARKFNRAHPRYGDGEFFIERPAVADEAFPPKPARPQPGAHP